MSSYLQDLSSTKDEGGTLTLVLRLSVLANRFSFHSNGGWQSEEQEVSIPKREIFSGVSLQLGQVPVGSHFDESITVSKLQEALKLIREMPMSHRQSL